MLDAISVPGNPEWGGVPADGAKRRFREQRVRHSKKHDQTPRAVEGGQPPRDRKGCWPIRRRSKKQ